MEGASGLEAIQQMVSGYISTYGFRTASTSTPVRQGDYVINFMEYGTDAASMSPGISVVEVKDGKIVNPWVYPAE